MQQVAYHNLRVHNNVQFKIAVQTDHPDPIGQAIVDQTYSFPPPYQALFELMRPGCRVLDLGAHIGTFSLAAAALGCEVISVEASPVNAALLQTSVDKNVFKQMRVVNAAVSDHTGTLEFIPAGPYGLVANPAFSEATVRVPAITVDDLLVQTGWDRVDLLKMDVEGSEVAAIRGMPRLLSRADAPAVLYESNGHTLHFFGQTPRSLLAALEEFGYRSYIPGDHNLTPFSAAEFQPECLVDYLAVKQPPAGLQDWQVLPPLTQEERIQKILQTCVHWNAHSRMYIARMLPEAGEVVLRDPRVFGALSVMQVDASPEVRTEAICAWTIMGQQHQAMIGAMAGESTAMLNHLAALEKQADVMLRSYQVRSHIPVLGGLITWVRRNLTSHLREPYLDPTLERQVAFNRQLVNELRQITQRQTMLLQYLSQLEASLQAIGQQTHP